MVNGLQELMQDLVKIVPRKCGGNALVESYLISDIQMLLRDRSILLVIEAFDMNNKRIKS